jgi:DeoD family purine-nucleoside phosphorylase
MNKEGIKKFFKTIFKVLSILLLVLLFIVAGILLFYIVSNQVARNQNKAPIVGLYTIISPSMEPAIKVYDVVLADSAWSESSYAYTHNGYDQPVTYPSEELNNKMVEAAKRLGKEMRIGRIHSSDVFYRDLEKSPNKAVENGCVCVEMESFALFHNAKVTGKQAACVCTISDSLVDHTETTPEERQNSFTNMMEIALEAVTK